MVGSDLKSICLLAILAIYMFSLCHDQKMIPVVAAENCDVDLRGLEIECMYYMHMGEPSTLLDPNDRCCKVIKDANIPCCCSNLTRKLVYPPGYSIEDMLDWNKVLHSLNFCGKPLAVGTLCGNFTVPPQSPPSKS